MRYLSSLQKSLIANKISNAVVTKSGVISNKPCLLLESSLHATGISTGWVFPISHIEPTGYWSNPAYLYDGLMAYTDVTINGFSYAPTFTIIYSHKIYTNKIQIYPNTGYGNPLEVYFYILVDGFYKQVAAILFMSAGWVEVNFDDYYSFDRLNLVLYQNNINPVNVKINEFMFYSDNKITAQLFDGHSESGKLLKTLFTEQFRYDRRSFYQPIMFSKGLYASFGSNKGELFLRYIVLDEKTL